MASVMLAGTLGAVVAPVAAAAASGPLVSSVEEHIANLPLTLHFAPGPGHEQVVEYRHWSGTKVNEAVTVPAGPDGTASTVILVTGDYGNYIRNVVARTADGWVSPPTPFTVTSAPPLTITSTVYPSNVKRPGGRLAPAGGVGIPGDFTITRLTDRLTEVTYEVEGQRTTVPFGPDGTVTVTFTPTRTGFAQFWTKRPDGLGGWVNLRHAPYWVASSTGPLTSDITDIYKIAYKCIDVADSAAPDRTKVQSWACDGSDRQIWTRPGDGTVRAFGKCLDVTSSGTADGTKVQLYRCNGTNAQQWSYQPMTRALVNPLANKCLDVPNASTTNGVQLQVYTCDGSLAQRWALSE